MALSPLDKGYQYKKEQMLKLVNLTEEQHKIVEIYLMEEQTGKRHWEWDPDDPEIYLEWMNGTSKLRNRINVMSAMSRQQKAIYNSGMDPNNPNGNSSGKNTAGQQGRTKTTSSGRILTPETHPNLFQPHKRR